MASVGRESQERQGIPAAKGLESLVFRGKWTVRREKIMNSGASRAQALKTKGPAE
jgi:hypothetical protein